jgi:hypothetical protein
MTMTNAGPADERDQSTFLEFATYESQSTAAPRGDQAHDPDAIEESIRVLAYFKWEAAGSPEGDGVDYWLEAEREVTANLTRSFGGG